MFLGSSRHLGVLEKSVSGFCGKGSDSQNSKDVAVELSHDLCMLHLIETFSESAPQIVLWLTIILQDGKLDVISGGVGCGVGQHNLKSQTSGFTTQFLITVRF